MATAILKLYEQGLIDLDKPIDQYLPENIKSKISLNNRIDKITIRMLLNHTSGIPGYSLNPNYTALFVQHPFHSFLPEEYVGFIANMKSEFEPGSKHSYSDTNYNILALIADKITGDHAKFIQEQILQSLNLNNTFYHYPSSFNNPNLVNTYFNRFSNGQIENVSKWQNVNTSSLVGDDGIVATPIDYVKFLKGLFEGKLLKSSTMDQMLTWTKNSDGKPVYGLGLSHIERDGLEIYGHGGGGLGAGGGLYYIPQKHLYVFFGANAGVLVEGPITDR